MRLLTLSIAAALTLATPAVAAADVTLSFQTADWQLEAPDSLGTQQDLELNGRQIQLCTDEIKRLIHHRPAGVARFLWRWGVGGGPGSWASPTSVQTLFPDASAYGLVDPAARSLREDVVARGVCLGPHEITHVLTAESWTSQLWWANEGFATLTDWLYQTASWRYGEPVTTPYACDATGWTDGVRHTPYSDLRQFVSRYDMYATAACFWLEVEHQGGFRALRRILMRLRAYRASTAGQLLLQHVNPVLGVDFRPIAQRLGFTDADLVADGPPPPDPPAPSLTTSAATPAAAARAGRRFTLTVAVARSDTGDPPASATVACAARVRTRLLRPSSQAYDGERASCAWSLPRTDRGRTLRATISVAELGVRSTTPYSTRIR